MSLRRNLLLWLSLILLVALTVSGLLSYWQSMRRVDVEMNSALAVADAKLRDAVRARESTTGVEAARDMIALFNGDRHIDALLNNHDGTVMARSKRAINPHPAPAWFEQLLTSPAQTRTVTTEGDNGSDIRITLKTNASSEISELWEELKLRALIVLGLAALVIGVVSAVLHKALKPLEALSNALDRVGAGVFGTKVPVGGPSELAKIYTQFNLMSEALGELEQQNAALKTQIESIQEEERAEIARDLHDEFGPFLFAVDADAQTIPSLVERAAHDDAHANVARIRQSVRHMQTHLRAILGKLKPANMIDLGLSHATDNLVAFWKSRRPDTRFEVDIDERGFGPKIDAVVFRIFQEGLSNAIRHGNPSNIKLATERKANGVLKVIVCDNGIGLNVEGKRGFGLTGMRERIAALGGTLSISDKHPSSGVEIIAVLPTDQTFSPQHNTRIVEHLNS